MLLSLALLASLFFAFFMLLVPLKEYDTSPAVNAADAVKRYLKVYVAGERGKEILEKIGKSTQEVVKTGIASGLGLALIVSLLLFSFLGAYTALVAIGAFVLGLYLTQAVIQNEYRQWQQSIFEGVPDLINFMPAFLETGVLTPKEALVHSLSFIPEPLRGELENASFKIKRTGKVKDTMDALSKRVDHPTVDAVCFRLSSAWDARISADIFEDLAEQVEDMTEIAISRATSLKTGYLALVCVLGLIGMLLIYGYPGVQFMMEKMSGIFV